MSDLLPRLRLARTPVHSFDAMVDSDGPMHVMDDLAACWCRPTVYQRPGERVVEIKHHVRGALMSDAGGQGKA